MTNPNYQIYNGVDITATKRYSNRWQMQAALTIQTTRATSRTGRRPSSTRRAASSANGVSTIAQERVQVSGSYTLPWDINASANFNMIRRGGARR